MSLFGKHEKQIAEQLQSDLQAAQLENERLRALLTPEMQNLEEVQHRLRLSCQRLQEIAETTKTEIEHLQVTKEELAKRRLQIIETDENILVQTFGLYKPRYAFSSVDGYKQKLDEIRKEQKQLIKDKQAVSGITNWSVNGNTAEGKKMVSDTQKLLLRAFNLECDDLVERVKFSNLEMSQRRIESTRDSITKLGRTMNISISDAYYHSKLEELYLSYEYQVKKQEEKEAQKEIRDRMREEAKLAKELEEARRKIEKEQAHYTNALTTLRAQIAMEKDVSRLQDLMQKETEIAQQVENLETAMKEVDYREANQRAGYVYIISNIGAFGNDVYKIGMTRRLDPMDRIFELSDASVPFNFDVHAMIFTEDAPKLETALHQAFADRRLNHVNLRREFFHVTLSEVKKIIAKNFDKTVEFVDVAPAAQYRESVLLRQQLNRGGSEHAMS